KDIIHLACWAHARREFEKALQNDRPRAEKALMMIQKLYKIERRAKEEQLSADRIKELRLEEALPVINEMGKWIFQEIKNTLPKSQIGKAMAYAYARWDALSAYLHDGNLQIDNNLCENAIRPVALGRKNVSALWSTSMNNLMLFLALLDEQRRKKSSDVCDDSRLAAERPEQETLLRGKWHQ